MPDKWRQMELALAAALAPEQHAAEPPAHPQDEALCHAATDADKVAFLVEVPEKMWQRLDEGESLKALQLYQRASSIHDECSANAAEEEFPFLPAHWACIQCFRPRMLTCAISYLTCRGRESQFYADNLCTLAVLSDPPIGADKLFEVFLESRSKWMAPVHKQDDGERSTKASSKKERSLMIILKTISMAISQAEDIFGGGGGSGLLSSIAQLPPDFKDDLEKFLASGKLVKVLTSWFQHKQQQVSMRALMSFLSSTRITTAFVCVQIFEVSSPIITSIESISLLSRVQTKLYAVNQSGGGCLNVKLWGQVLSEWAGSGDKQSVAVESVFDILFAEAFRKRTRDLVQNSFVEALELIKSQIRASLEDTATRTSQSEYRLRNVKFYDYFETIQKKAADLDASDLQSVLIEEFLRTLFKLIIFFEQDYPLPGNQKAGSVKQAPSVFLSISNILAGIVAGFHHQMNKLFPGSTATVSTPDQDCSQLAIGPSFERYNSEGFVMRSQLKSDIMGDLETTSFIDEELRRVDALGFYSLYLVSEIKRKTSYPQVFVNVLHGLTKKYCEAWASMLLDQKIEPLRELMQIERYDSTNEEWIATHEGWIEQVISDEGLGGDTDDSSSESEMTLGDEKVWLPWCETPTVSSFLFSCCYSLDDANRLVQNAIGTTDDQIKLMQLTIRDVLVEQLTIVSVAVYDAAVSLLVKAKATQKDSVLNFGECCIQQFLFDMYFVRATLGFSDFIRFGWGDELNPDECSPALLKLKSLFERMREFIDPVDWEIYGPQLIENVLTALSVATTTVDGKEIVIGAQDTRPLARIAEPVARFSLLPVPSNRRKFQRTMSRSSEDDSAEGRSRANSSSLFHERPGADVAPQTSAMKLQNLLSSSASSNIFSAATSGSNLLSSAAKGIGFLSSATTNRYF
ncbi:unnamed protein product [Phytophthora fragariaefolia]|uniref:Conserved oligomeric Golgi complex subunit 1 n=1 Tax=Phytophthora fragariaefolia TaxID=1490495 RepID=A0A9W6TPS0_9STRA|nr:unnamed protein product [Phytophthora fragariaefolia]